MIGFFMIGGYLHENFTNIFFWLNFLYAAIFVKPRIYIKKYRKDAVMFSNNEEDETSSYNADLLSLHQWSFENKIKKY